MHILIGVGGRPDMSMPRFLRSLTTIKCTIFGFMHQSVTLTGRISPGWETVYTKCVCPVLLQAFLQGLWATTDKACHAKTMSLVWLVLRSEATLRAGVPLPTSKRLQRGLLPK